jgi:lysophospholipase L1-like esterase
MSRTGIFAINAGALALAAVLLGGCAGPPLPSLVSKGESPSPSTSEAFTIVVIGDSIPFNAPEDCPGCTGFAQGFADGLEADRGQSVDLLNLSRHDGARTRDIEVEVTGDNNVTKAVASADIVLVSIGFNDQPPYTDAALGCSAPDILTDADAIAAVQSTTTECIDEATGIVRGSAIPVLDAVRSLAPDAAVGVMTQYNSWIGWGALDSATPGTVEAVVNTTGHALDRWNDALCEEAADIDAVCVDVYRAFNGDDGRQPAGTMLAADYTHPSQLGNDAIRDLLLAVDWES